MANYAANPFVHRTLRAAYEFQFSGNLKAYLSNKLFLDRRAGDDGQTAGLLCSLIANLTNCVHNERNYNFDMS